MRADRTSSHIAVALPSGSVDTDGARGILQERVGLWTKWACLLSSGFYLANIISWPFTMPQGHTVIGMLVLPGPMFHLAASLLLGIVWLVARRVPMSTRTLQLLDFGAMLSACTLYTLMGVNLVDLQRELDLPMLLGIYSGLLA